MKKYIFAILNNLTSVKILIYCPATYNGAQCRNLNAWVSGTTTAKCLWTNLQCVATHSLLQYSLSQSLLSTAGLVQPARTQMLLEFSVEATLGTGATFTSTSIWDVEGDKQTLTCEPMEKYFCEVFSAGLNQQKSYFPPPKKKRNLMPIVVFFTWYNIHMPVLFIVG